MGERRGNEPSRFDDYEQKREFRLILGIAEALRQEFGVGIDAHPGGRGTEAGVVNRAFRAAVSVILGEVIPSAEISGAMTHVLRGATLRRLVELDVARDTAERVLDLETGMGDRWLAYLALAPASLIGEIVRTSGR